MTWVLMVAVIVAPILLMPQWSDGVELILNNVPAQVYFSPGGGATAAIVREICGAKREILVQAYTLSSQPILKALLDAHQRGVKVQVILDKSERAEGMTPQIILARSGVPVFLDGKHALAHSNVAIVDGETVITGSFNFTKASAEMNAEDSLIIKSSRLAGEYRDNWERHKAHSESD